jgi:hypothetical protein
MTLPREQEEILEPEGAIPDDAIPPHAHALLCELPEIQQHAVLALVGGLNQTQTARAVSVNRRTIIRWSQSEPFIAAQRAISEAIFSHQVRAALEAFFQILERDVKAGRGTNVRWFLARTVFRDFELERARSRRGDVNVVLSQSVKEAQEATQSVIKNVWESRLEDGGLSRSPADP